MEDRSVTTMKTQLIRTPLTVFISMIFFLLLGLPLTRNGRFYEAGWLLNFHQFQPHFIGSALWLSAAVRAIRFLYCTYNIKHPDDTQTEEST